MQIYVKTVNVNVGYMPNVASLYWSRYTRGLPGNVVMFFFLYLSFPVACGPQFMVCIVF